MRVLILALRGIAIALLAGLILLPFAQVILRGVFNVPMSGAEEITRYLLICLTFLAACLVSIDGGQIRMEEFQALIPDRPRWLIQLAIELASTGLFAFLTVAAVITISRNLNATTATTEMPFLFFMGPLAVGAALLTLANIVLFWRTFARGRPDAKQTTLT
jgi:TRAP-type C4-dicarboxylate transport system permease small subunit